MDIIYQILLILIALNFLGFALWGMYHPDSLSRFLGYKIDNPSGWSEFSAIYVGVFLAQFALAIFAFIQKDIPIFGQMLAISMLLQGTSRILPLIRFGKPNIQTWILGGLELGSAVLLLFLA